MSERYQVVLCSGPRCRASAGWSGLAQAIDAATQTADGRLPVYRGSYDCFGFCREAPNLVVRKLASDAADPGQPGLYDLDDSIHYPRADGALLTRLLHEHCGLNLPGATAEGSAGGRPVPGRSKPY